MNTIRVFRRALALTAFALSTVATAPLAWTQTEFRYPADSGILDVTKPPYNAVGDGVADDTQAIKQAINDSLDSGLRYSATKYVYLPKGTYRITSQLESRIFNTGWSNGWRAGMILVGESTTQTILKLDDGLAGYQDPAAPAAVIKTGSEDPGTDAGGNRAFRHSIHNLTVDVGSGNPGAVGIDYITNNRGSIENVIVRSSDVNRVGHIGISMRRYGPGPGILKNVEVIGFTRAMDITHHEYGMTMENITVRNQTQYGIRLAQNILAIRNLTSVNHVPVLYQDGAFVVTVIVGGNFTGGLSTNAAIQNVGANLFLRDITSSGYGQVVNSSTSGGSIAGGTSATTVAEYSSHGTEKAFAASPSTSLRLPIEETPTYHTNDHTKWVNVLNHGATLASGNDDGPGIQAAIDAAPIGGIVYLPSGDYNINSTIILRGNARKIVGLRAGIKSGGGLGSAPAMRFDGGSADSMVLEELYIGGALLHNSSKTLAIRHVDMAGYSNTVNGTGKFFAEDVIGKPYHIRHPQQMWGRQINSEFGEEPLIENHRGKIWLLGYKTEGEMTIIENTAGSVELLGALVYPLKSVPTGRAMIINDEGNISASWKKTASTDWTHRVRERRNGVWASATSGVPTLREALYVGGFNDAANIAADSTAPTVPQSLQASPLSAYAVKLTWNASTDDTRLLGYEVFQNGVFLDFITENTFTVQNLNAGTQYSFRVEAVDVKERRSGLSTTASVITPAAPLLAEYTFSNSSLASTDVHGTTTAGNFTDGPGIVGGTSFEEGGRRVHQGVLVEDMYQAWRDENHFYFTVTPVSGTKLNLQRLTFESLRLGSSPDNLTVTCSADGFTEPFTTTVSTVWKSFVWDKSEDVNFQHLEGAVTFRFTFHGSGSTGTNTARKSFIDNVRLYAIVGNSPLPAPTQKTLAFYNFDNSVNSIAYHPSVTAGAIFNGPGLNGSTMYHRGGWSTNKTVLNSTITQAIAEGDYLAFTVTPGSGSTMKLSALQFYGWRDTSMPERMRVASSIDNYTVHYDLLVPHANVSWGLDGLSQFQNLTSAVTFRFYFYGNNAGGTDVSRKVLLDTIKLLGTTVGATGPVAPGNLATQVLSSDAIRLDWLDLSNSETGFEVESKVGAGSFQPVSTEPANSTGVDVVGLSPSTTYSFRVRAINNSGNSAWTPEVSAQTQGATTRSNTGVVTLGGDYSTYSGQVESGTVSLVHSGTGVTMTGNMWMKYPLNYTVTTNTVLKFTVNASNAGEILGIGLDEDNLDTNGQRIFQVGGSDAYSNGWPVTPIYTAGSGAVTYTVPVGNYFTGSMNWLVLALDADALANGNATFSNIEVWEQDPTGTEAITVANYPLDSSLASTDVDAQSTAGNLTPASGYTSTDYANGGRRVLGAGVGGTAENNLANGEYFGFTVTPQTGRRLSLSELSFKASRGSGSPDKVSVFVLPLGGTLGGQTVKVLDNISVSITPITHSVPLDTGEYDNLTGLEVRLVFHGNNQGTGSNFLDDMSLTAVNSVAEVATAVTQANYTFTSSSLASVDTDANSIASTFENGSGFTSTTFSTDARVVFSAGLSGNTAAANNVSGEYFKFVLTPSGTRKLYMDMLSIKAKRGGSSPDRMTVYALPTGGSSSGQTVVVLDTATVTTTLNPFTIDLSQGAFDELTLLELRVIFHGSNQGGGSNFLDDVTLEGAALN